MMMKQILLCSDLDRTLIPNGVQPESPQARKRLKKIAAHESLTLVYVSGRHKALLTEAIEEFGLPTPDYAIGDVGTTIYEIQGQQWQPWKAWHDEIAPDWQGYSHEGVVKLFEDMDDLRLQEPEKQNTFKVSYYAPEELDHQKLIKEMQQRLALEGIRASLIWSIDEVEHIGLLDILPEQATKLHAIRFLMKKKGFDDEHTVFAGDSGNDLPVLTSGMQAVLVRNATDSVRESALNILKQSNQQEKLYQARGEFLGMNGNYAAGVLEGLAYFIPETKDWMTDSPRETGTPTHM